MVSGDLLGKFGKNGIVISGIVTWIGSQIDTQNNDSWKSLANRCLLDGELTAAKQTLKNIKGPNSSRSDHQEISVLEMQNQEMVLVRLC